MAKRVRMLAAVLLAAAILAPVLTAAQAPPNAKPQVTPKTQQRDDPKACAHEHATVGSGGAVQKGQPLSLSDRLAQSNGVICPPSRVDPQMPKPAPKIGTMPVIPPPGSPGGNPEIEPK